MLIVYYCIFLIYNREFLACKLKLEWLPRGVRGKESACQCKRHRRHGLGRFLGGGNGDPLQYSCLGNPMDRGAWQATVYGVETS